MCQTLTQTQRLQVKRRGLFLQFKSCVASFQPAVLLISRHFFSELENESPEGERLESSESPYLLWWHLSQLLASANTVNPSVFREPLLLLVFVCPVNALHQMWLFGKKRKKNERKEGSYSEMKLFVNRQLTFHRYQTLRFVKSSTQHKNVSGCGQGNLSVEHLKRKKKGNHFFLSFNFVETHMLITAREHFTSNKRKKSF